MDGSGWDGIRVGCGIEQCYYGANNQSRFKFHRCHSVKHWQDFLKDKRSTFPQSTFGEEGREIGDSGERCNDKCYLGKEENADLWNILMS